MADELIDVSAEWAKRAYVDDAKYKAMYEASIKDPAGFWGEHGKRVDWIRPYSDGAVRDVDYTGNVHIRWYYDGVLNVSANCVDRHLAKRADQTAIIWEGDDPKDDKKVTYQELHDEVCRMANILRNRNGLPLMPVVILLFGTIAWLRLRDAAKVELPRPARAG